MQRAPLVPIYFSIMALGTTGYACQFRDAIGQVFANSGPGFATEKEAREFGDRFCCIINDHARWQYEGKGPVYGFGPVERG